MINSLEGGGAERVLTILLRQFAQYMGQYAIHLALLDAAERSFALPEFVETHELNSGGSLVGGTRALLALMKRLEPEATVSFLTRANCAAVIASRLSGRRCLISERVNTTSHLGNDLRGRVQRLSVRALYPYAHRVLCVSHGVRDDLVRGYGVKPDRATVIPNPYELDDLAARAAEPPEIALPERYIVGVGRMTQNKNFALLIRAYARANPDASLVLLGEGPERARLEALARDLGVGDRVVAPGFASNPFSIVARAAFFVSASNAEGFPNAQAEALALGCPVIATDCPSGPAELLSGSAVHPRAGVIEAEYGMLTPVGDEAALAEAMQKMAIAERLAYYAKAGPKRAAQFSAPEIAARYWAEIMRAATA